MKLDEAREVLGVSASATEDEVKKQFRKFAMQWHPDKAAHCTSEEKARREEKMKEINSAYVRLQKGEDSDDDEDDDFFPTGPWSMPDELIALLMETLFQQRKGRRGRRGGPGFHMGGGGASFSFDIPMFDHGRPGRGAHGGSGLGGSAYGNGYHDGDSGDDGDSDEEGCHFAYDHGRPRRRPGPHLGCDTDRNMFTQEDYEKNRAAENALYEHQRREAERLHMRQQKAVVMKVIDKLPKPVKTDVSDNTITLTIDRSRKLRGSFPEGGFWELQYRETHGRRESQSWRPYAERITDTSVTVEGLVPGTSYDFQARGGFEGMGDITMGGFSVMATVQTTGKRPVPASSGATAAATATATPAQARASGKVPSKTARSTGEAGKASTGPGDRAAGAVNDEAEQRRQAQREDAAAREAAVAAAAREEAAKREAERKKAVQARLDQEADEYAKLMQQHARRAAPAAPGDSKKKKKKKHKKEAPVAPSCAAVEADPIPESIDGDAPGEFEHYDPNDFEKAIGSDEWTPVRGRDRPKAPPPPANGPKTAPSAARGRMSPRTRHTAPQHTPPQPTAAASPLLEGQVFDDVSPDEIRQLRGERAAALAAEEELMIQEALARSLSETQMDAVELMRLESEAAAAQHTQSVYTAPSLHAERPGQHRGLAAGGVRGALDSDGATGCAAAAAATAAAASVSRRMDAAGGLPRAGGRGSRSSRSAQRGGHGSQHARGQHEEAPGSGRGRRSRGRGQSHEWGGVDSRRAPRHTSEHYSPVLADPIQESFDPILESPMPSPIPEPLDDPLPEQASDFSSTLHEPFGSSPYGHTLSQTTDYMQPSFDQPDFQQPVQHAPHSPAQQYAPPDAYAPHDAYAAPQHAGSHSPAVFDNGAFQSPGMLQSTPHAPPTAASTWGPPEAPAPASGSAAQPYGGSIGAANWSAPPAGAPATAIRGADVGNGGGLGLRPGAGRGPSSQGPLFQAYNKRRPGVAAHGLSPASGPAPVDAPPATVSKAQPAAPGHAVSHNLDPSMPAAPPGSEPRYDPLQQMQPAASAAFAPSKSTFSAGSASFRPQPQALWAYGERDAQAATSSAPLGVSAMYGTASSSAGGAASYGVPTGAPSYTSHSVNLPETLIDTPSTMSGHVQTNTPPRPPPSVQHPGLGAGGYFGMPNGQTPGDANYYANYGYSTGQPVGTEPKQQAYDMQTPHHQQAQPMPGWYASNPGVYMRTVWGPPHYPIAPVPPGMHVGPVNGYPNTVNTTAAGRHW